MSDDTNQTKATLDDVLSLADAAQLAGITAHTLAQQAERGRLHGRKIGRTWVTTRHWLTEYLREYARHR